MQEINDKKYETNIVEQDEIHTIENDNKVERNWNWDLRCNLTKRTRLIFGSGKRETEEDSKKLRVSPINSIRNKLNEDGIKNKIAERKLQKLERKKNVER